MKRTLHMWAVFLATLGGACVYGSSVEEALDPLEGPLRACCTAAGVPDTYEDVRRRIETFHAQIPGKTTTLTRLALMEECFLPQWLAQELALVHVGASRSAAKVQEDIHTWHTDKDHEASAPTTLFLKNIGMTKVAFTALAYKEQMDKFDAYDKTYGKDLLSRTEGDVPHMIWESALHHYNRGRDPQKFALLYYTFMVCVPHDRLGKWQSLVAMRAYGSYEKGFEFYEASDAHKSLQEALMDLPYIAFPYPEDPASSLR